MRLHTHRPTRIIEATAILYRLKQDTSDARVPGRIVGVDRRVGEELHVVLAELKVEDVEVVREADGAKGLVPLSYLTTG